MLYFDSASTSIVYPEVIKKINEVFLNYWANPINMYTPGIEAKNLIEEARMKIAKAINASPEEIIFTSGSSEANALALNQKECCICSEYEHHDIVANPKVKTYPEIFVETIAQNKEIFPENFAFWKKYMYVHMLVNNETGEIFDLRSKIAAAHEVGMTVLVDATQALGNVNIDVKKIDADFMSFSFHKVHGPKGIGALYVKKELLSSLKPIIYGSQEQGKRGGTSNVPYIVGSGLAVEKAIAELSKKWDYTLMLRTTIIQKLKENNIDFIVNEGAKNIPSILNIAFAKITGEAMMLALNQQGIYIGTGSACNTGNHEPSQTLKAMKVNEKYIQGAIRISLSLENTKNDVNYLIEKIIEVYNKMIS